MNVPGIAAKHAIIRDGCRTGRGDMPAFEEAVNRLRQEYRILLDAWPVGKGVEFHVVLTVDRPKEDQ